MYLIKIFNKKAVKIFIFIFVGFLLGFMTGSNQLKPIGTSDFGVNYAQRFMMYNTRSSLRTYSDVFAIFFQGIRTKPKLIHAQRRI